jgi:hypothetical protein
MTLIPSFLLRVFYNLTINALTEHFRLKVPRKVSNISYITIRQ